MFLKRLEIQGFKSFAEEMDIEFTPGMTTVVGPNGSGKSNIADGIRWVLGEQSPRSLRGSKMEDVIFAGSDTRAPLNMAEVTLVLNNEQEELGMEWSEISVTRKLYRSGESEYLINRQPCRRRDIVDLFMDSGMGREAFSIIGQGRVEEVLSSRPEDRRSIFEEAAGVLKYKQRKQQAGRKLEDTVENLQRVEDILHELESQIEPLKEQASLAKEYLEKSEELEQQEAALTVYEIEERHALWKAQVETAEQLERKYKQTEKEWISLQDERERLTSRIKKQAGELEEDQQKYMALREQLEKEEGRRLLFQEKEKNIEEKKAELQQRIEQLHVQAEFSQKEWEAQTDELQQMKTKEDQVKESLSLIQKQLAENIHSLQPQIEEMKSDYIEKLNARAAIRNEEKYLQDQQIGMRRKAGSADAENEAFLNERKQAEAAFAEKQEESSEWSREDAACKEAEELAEKNSRLAGGKASEKEKQMYKAYRYLDEAKSRLSLLKEMETDYSGFNQGVKEILKARSTKLNGIIGAVAELITVPDKYVTAVETALGAAMQHIVVEEEADARGAISYLKQQKKGRATFLPITSIRGKEVPANTKKQLEQMAGFEGVAASHISADNKYHAIVHSLLGHVILAADLEAANQMARQSGFRVRIVTLEGDVVNPGGSMTGGALQRQGSALLGRKQERIKLEASLKDMQEKTIRLETEAEQAKLEAGKQYEAWQAAKSRREQARSKAEEARGLAQEAKTKLDNVTSKLSHYDREALSLQTELNRIQEREALLQENKESVQAAIEKLDEDISAVEQKETARTALITEAKEKETALKMEWSALHETVVNQERETARLKKEHEQKKAELQSASEDLEYFASDIVSMQGGEKQLQSDINEVKEAIEELSARIEAVRTDQQQRTEKNEEIEQTQMRLQKKQTQEQNSHHEAKVQMNRLDAELETRLQFIQDHLSMSFERAKETYTLEGDPEAVRDRIHLLKLDISELGTVNLGAVEEYERVHERFTFLSGQKEDLTGAKESLDEVMAEMDEEVTRRFSESFTAIKKEFQQIYAELFGGGEADLYLTNPDDLLTTGVDIMARPPGKKRQHLSLLSGGEKALTAIALLFAIVKVKPAPFCVLDEVEAALDEANVTRFARYLRTFSETTQFIVISHRKGTMEEADVLYGVTMQESGVSRMVSVRLEEAMKATV